MHFDLWTFALQTANFLVLVWLLQKFLYRPVLKAIDARRDAAAKLTAELEARNKAAAALRTDLEQQRAAIAKAREDALGAARDAAETERKALLDKARGEADALRARGKTEFERERALVVRSLGADAARLAVAIVRRLLGQPVSAGIDARMFELVCQDVQALPEDERRRVTERLSQPGGRIAVVTAAVLDEATQKTFARDLAKALGTQVCLDFQADPGLLAGVELRFPYTILRRSWACDLERIQAELIHDDGAQKVA